MNHKQIKDESISADELRRKRELIEKMIREGEMLINDPEREHSRAESESVYVSCRM